jgi:PKD repeat protein
MRILLYTIYLLFLAGSVAAQHSVIGHSLSRTNYMRGNGLSFALNKGQIIDAAGKPRPDILYKGNGAGASIYLRNTGISYVYSNMSKIIHETEEQVEELIKTGAVTEATEAGKKKELMQKQILNLHRVDMDFVNCNNNIITRNEDEVDGCQNFYYPHCPDGITNVKQYNKVTFKNIYNNIDITYYGSKADGIKYDLIVQPHADPSQVKLRWIGAENIRINNEGRLVIKTSVNEFYESIPKVYQTINGQIIEIKATYKLNNEQNILTKETRPSPTLSSALITFELEAWNHEYPLIIDPWVTYYSGNVWDRGSDIATDPSGNVLFTGETSSTNFPVSAGAFQTTLASAKLDAYAVKMDANGTPIWATYFGGTDDDSGVGITADNGAVVVTGYTKSNDLPVGGSVVYQNTQGGGGGQDAFIFQLNATGARSWATYYGGNSDEAGIDITKFGNNVYLYGYTYSTNGISTPGAFQTTNRGSYDYFVAKFDAFGNRIWGTFVGGSANEHYSSVLLAGGAITCDSGGNIYITGMTQSVDFPVSLGCHQPTFGGTGMDGDGFVFKFGPGGNRLWATYYGGTSSDAVYSVVIDSFDDVILVGYTSSSNAIASSGAFQPVFNGGGFPNSDAFIAKFSSTGVRKWGTYFGSAASLEFFFDVAVDRNDNIYAYGEAEDVAADNLAYSCSYQPVFGGVEDQLIVKYIPDGKQKCVTYMGGTTEDDLDYGGGIAIYNNSLYINGTTEGGYPVTPGAFQTVAGGPLACFVASLCLNICEGKVLGLNYTANTTNVCINTPVTYTPSIANSCDTSGYKFKWVFTGGTPATSTLPSPSVTYAAAGSYSVKLIVTTICKKDSVINSNYITVTPCTVNATATGATICQNSCATITAAGSNGNPPYTYSWNNGAASQSTNVCPFTTTTYTVKVTDASGATVIVTPLVTVKTPMVITVTTTNINCSIQGQASVSITSGAAPYTYRWSNGEKTDVISSIAEGGYTITVTDGNGCTGTKSVIITNNSPASAAFTFNPACVGQPVTFTNTGSTGAYLWRITPVSPANISGNSANLSYTFLTAGTYSVYHLVVTAGCSVTVISNITINACGGVTAAATGATICPGSCTVVTSSGSNGTSPYTYSWSNGSSVSTINSCPPSTTTYTVQITDAIGASATTTATVIVNPPINVSITTNQVSCNSVNNGSAIATAGGGTSPFAYVWSAPGATTQTINGLGVGTYSVTVSDATGCTAAKSTTIIAPLTVQYIKGSANCAGCGCKEWIMLSASDGISPYTYSWPGGYDKRYMNKLCPGNYTIKVTDKNGCSINLLVNTP